MNIKNQKGQSLVEYLILVAVIAVGSIAIVKTVGASLNVKFAKVAEALGAQVQGTPRAPVVSESSYKKKDLRNFMDGALEEENQNQR